MLTIRVTPEEYKAILKMRGSDELITCTQAAELLGTTAVDVAAKIRNNDVDYGIAEPIGGGRFRYKIWLSKVEAAIAI